MKEPIITKDKIRAKARAAHARGVDREGHNFNWHSQAAIDVWQEEWDLCQADAEQLEVSPP